MGAPSKAYHAAELVLRHVVEIFDDVAGEFKDIDGRFSDMLERCADACSDALDEAKQKRYWAEKNGGGCA